MLGDALVLFSMAVHARYTILDAQGAGAKARKPVRATKGKKLPVESRSCGPGIGACQAVVVSPQRGRRGSHLAPGPVCKDPRKLQEQQSRQTRGTSDNQWARRRAARRAMRTARRSQGNETEDDYDFDADRPLSKAERKALRRKDRQRQGES